MRVSLRTAGTAAGLVTVLVVACGPYFWHPRPVLPKVLKASDWRRAYVGTWAIALVLDSLRKPMTEADSTRPPLVPAEPQEAWIEGTLHISDSTLGQDDPPILARLDLDMSQLPEYVRFSSGAAYIPAGSRPLAFGGDGIALHRHKGSVYISFTPRVMDYWWGLIAPLRGDSLVGRWEEESWGSVLACGRFKLARVP